MKNISIYPRIALAFLFLSFSNYVSSQTNVFDDIIVPSPNHTYLELALIQENLDVALQNSSAQLTVFAPDDNAFTNLAASFNLTVTDLLALPNLTDILTYHVLGVNVSASAINNGDVVNPLSTTNTIKLTKTSTGNVFVNHSQVISADITADNGVVHVISDVILPVETVADIAIDNGFTTLVTAVIQEELLPVLTNPLSSFTVFAPSNTAFDNLALAFGVTVNDLLALPNLSDILTYHVIGAEVLSTSISNGQIAQPISTTNTIKMSVNPSGVYANQAKVVTADILSDNGVVHVIDAVVLPSETVIDVAIDNNFTSLTAAVLQEGLLPILTNPLGQFTVFAPTDVAFDNLATDLGTDITGVLANPNLTDILLYHTLDVVVLSTSLSNGLVTTLNGQDISIDISSGVMINDANVTTADIVVDNGVVHVLDKVLLPSITGLQDLELIEINVYPNPTNNILNVENGQGEFFITNIHGQVVVGGNLNGQPIDVSNLDSGNYFIRLIGENNVSQAAFIKR
jgi:transforming growth factor-beta-induced protein